MQYKKSQYCSSVYLLLTTILSVTCLLTILSFPPTNIIAQDKKPEVDPVPSTSLGQEFVQSAAATVNNAVRPGFNTVELPGNDDGSTGLVPIGFQINFFGALYSQLYVNNNGNFTFNGPLATYTPFGLSNTNQSIIAPFFADVDTRLGNLAKYGPGGVNGKPAFGATWSAVGCYNQITSVLNSFQVILIDRSDSGAGNFDIEFNYDQIQWETGTASGGNGSCLGGSSAHVGYSNGTNTSFELPGSGIPGSFLDTNQITGLVHSSRNSSQRGRYLFEVRNGTVLTGGQIAGKVLDENLQPLTNALVQVCNAAGFCKLTSTNNLGEYSVSGLEAGQYTVTAFPPAGSNAETGAIGPFTLQTNQVLLDQNIILNLPNGLPTGTTITNLHINADGLPVVYWSSDLTLTTRGCPGGTASYQVTQNATVIRGGTMTEGPSGTYTGIIAAFYPIHGYASVTIQIHCPNNTTETAQFDIYIDPSGHVRTTNGTPIAGATVTLLRASSISGPFVQVPNGDAIMSPANRQNPDTTNIDGRFGWDVIAGFYVVRAAATGCHAPGNATQPFVESAVLTIPPPVTDLDLRLECAPPPPACIQYNVNLDGRKEVPANPSTARGAASIRVNTTNNTLSYYISYTGLSSRETSSHIQGFASVGSNAGVLHTLPLGTSKSGTWTYAEAQEANILAGLSYLNIRSLRYPNGEIRGQIANGITCSTAALAAEVSNLLAEAENSYTIFLPSVAR